MKRNESWAKYVLRSAAVAEQFEQVGRRKLPPRTVREGLAELYREIYGETLPVMIGRIGVSR